jgi:hypothetical protein
MRTRCRLSRAFVIAVKLADRPAYRIALDADLHPTTLSRLLHGAEPLRPNDPRVLRVAKILGLDTQTVFEPEEKPS